MERRRSTKAFFAVLALLLVVPGAARAAVAITPAAPQAGAHPDVTVNASFGATPTSVVLHFPPGLVGNPNASAARCAISTFETATCPSNTQVGTASAVSRTLGLSASGGVFNLVPHAGEPARLGIRLTALLVVTVLNEASISVRPDGSLVSTISPLDDGGVGLQSITLTLWGEHAGLSAPFMTEPTSCARATATLTAPPNATQTGAFTPTGCPAVPFSPSASISLQTTQRAVPSGATVTVRVPAAETPIRQSHVRSATVVLPAGTTLNPGVANGLQACTAAQFAGGRCPAASQIGTVSFATPLLGTLGGRVFFGDGLKLFVSVDDARVPLKLTGAVHLDPATGRITTVFDGLPQVPFTSFALTFQGGPRAVLANPATCGTKALAATLEPWSGGAARTATADFAIDAGCGAVPFRPTLSLAADSTRAGRPAGAATVTVARPDLDQDITRMSVDLPPGLAGSLAGIPLCGEAAANAGACPAATRVGSVSAVVGTGAAPVTLSGTVSLTGRFGGGLAGLAIAIPARVGPVNLGTAVVRAGLALRPADGGITVSTAPLPRFVGGVPVSIRRLALRLDRPGFVVNASSCALQQVRARITGSGGTVATVQAPYQATDCASLPFRPAISATAGAPGRDGVRGKPPLRTVVTVPAGDAATAATAVHLPPALSVDLARAARLCTFAQLSAGACPDRAVVGRATAVTPLLPVPLSGPVYLAQLRPSGLPGISLALRGPVSLRLDGANQFGANGGLTTTFAGIPDVPLARFELDFFGGAAGPLIASKDLCRGALPRISADFTGHNGARVTVNAPIRIQGCGPAVKIGLAGLPRHPRLTLRVRKGDGAAVRRVTLTLPSRLRGVAGHALSGRIDGRAAGGGALRLTRRTLTVQAAGARTVTVALGRGALRARRGTRRHARLAFVVRTVAVDGRRSTVRLNVRGA